VRVADHPGELGFEDPVEHVDHLFFVVLFHDFPADLLRCWWMNAGPGKIIREADASAAGGFTVSIAEQERSARRMPRKIPKEAEAATDANADPSGPSTATYKSPLKRPAAALRATDARAAGQQCGESVSQRLLVTGTVPR
jgi:hypothetical protein